MGKPSRKPPQRARRNVYPSDVVERSGYFRRLIEAQLMKYNIDLKDLPYAIGHTAKTTLHNRAHSGNLSLNDMLWIADYYDIDWNGIINSLKITREPHEVPSLHTNEELAAQGSPARAEVRKPKVNKSSAKAKRFGNLLLDSADDTDLGG